MSQDNLQQEFQNQVNDVFSRLQNKEMFQSDWDIASFAIFFIFIGMVVLLIILVLIRCCCCCCFCDEKVPQHLVFFLYWKSKCQCFFG
ncbi:small integral membrane protein 22 [Silurus meridionalis]|nr:small integral membrane protein 22 [Silurus meridionalis]